MTTRPALIAGGGIAGLTTALGLARAGRPARVFEQQSGFSELGAGVQMSPNAVRALQWLGAWEAVEPHCVSPAEIRVRNGESGAMLQRVKLGATFAQRFGAPYRVVHRGDLLAGLLAACKTHGGIELNPGQRALSAQSGRLVLADHPAAEGGPVIACDGIRSALRQHRWPGTVPAYRGHALYRALVPIDDVPAAVARDAVTLWLYPKGHVVHYPVSAGRAFNIVAAVDSSWHTDAWSEPGNAGDLAAVFARPHEELAAVLGAPRQWLRWAGADLPPPATWVAPGLALLGDAAHATLPYLAQGAAMALEDACVLSRALATAADDDTALSLYQEQRRLRCVGIQNQSRKLAGIYHAAGLMARARNAALRLMPADRFLDRNAWIYSWRPPD